MSQHLFGACNITDVKVMYKCSLLQRRLNVHQKTTPIIHVGVLRSAFISVCRVTITIHPTAGESGKSRSPLLSIVLLNTYSSQLGSLKPMFWRKSDYREFTQHACCLLWSGMISKFKSLVLLKAELRRDESLVASYGSWTYCSNKGTSQLKTRTSKAWDKQVFLFW